VLVEDGIRRPPAGSPVCLQGRGFNIESLRLGAAEGKECARAAGWVVERDQSTLQQMTKALNKLVNVLQWWIDLHHDSSWSGKLMLVKVSAPRSDAPKSSN